MPETTPAFREVYLLSPAVITVSFETAPIVAGHPSIATFATPRRNNRPRADMQYSSFSSNRFGIAGFMDYFSTVITISFETAVIGGWPPLDRSLHDTTMR